ncbi:MAG: hypothetical protein IJJ99_01860 [Oscillospiraceae bacterium]|nr:hypothetical protein [Oscillospiraceae bacterium]
MKYTKETFQFRTLPYAAKQSLADYGINPDAAKPVYLEGSTAYELYPIGRIGLYAIADIKKQKLLLIPALFSLHELVFEHNFGEQFDENGFAKALGATMGSGSALVGILATEYFMRQKADYIIKKLAIRFKDSESRRQLGEIVFAENYRERNVDVMTAFAKERLACLNEIGDFIGYEQDRITSEQGFCLQIMRNSKESYDSIRELIREVRIQLVSIGVNPKDIAHDAIAEYHKQLS